MKRLSIALVILLSLPVAYAQSDELPPPLRVVITVLGLSGDQGAALIATIRSRDAAVRPLAEQIQVRREALAQLMQTAAPDPAAVGQLVLEIRQLELHLSAIAHHAAETFEQTLDAEQQERLNGIRHAAPVCEVMPAFRAVGLM